MFLMSGEAIRGVSAVTEIAGVVRCQRTDGLNVLCHWRDTIYGLHPSEIILVSESADSCLLDRTVSVFFYYISLIVQGLHE